MRHGKLGNITRLSQYCVSAIRFNAVRRHNALEKYQSGNALQRICHRIIQNSISG